MNTISKLLTVATLAAFAVVSSPVLPAGGILGSAAFADSGKSSHDSKGSTSKDASSKDTGSKDTGSKDAGSKDAGSTPSGASAASSHDSTSPDAAGADHGSKDAPGVVETEVHGKKH